MTEIGHDRREHGCRLARDLAAGAIWSDGMCTFQGSSPPPTIGEAPRFGTVAADVYEGSAGIARFLALAASVDDDPDLRATAIGAIRHALHLSEGWSLFTGGCGIGLTAIEIGRHLDLPAIADEGRRLVDRSAEAAVETGAPADLLVGIAGVIIGLVAAREHESRWHRMAEVLGHSLMASAVEDGPTGPDGPPLSWALEPGSDVRLCGLAHGASGIAFAFESLAASAPHDASPWSVAARRARAYERPFYSAAHGSWADLREHDLDGGLAPDHPRAYPHMWCHGSIGIAWERLAAARHDVLARGEAAGALAGALAYADQLTRIPLGVAASDEVNSSLCHGIGGLVDLFVEASRTTGEPIWATTAAQLADVMISDARSGLVRSGIRGGWPTPGLMLGTAGAGWSLLRLDDDLRAPSGWHIGAWS